MNKEDKKSINLLKSILIYAKIAEDKGKLNHIKRYISSYTKYKYFVLLWRITNNKKYIGKILLEGDIKFMYGMFLKGYYIDLGGEFNTPW